MLATQTFGRARHRAGMKSFDQGLRWRRNLSNDVKSCEKAGEQTQLTPMWTQLRRPSWYQYRGMSQRRQSQSNVCTLRHIGAVQGRQCPALKTASRQSLDENCTSMHNEAF